LVGAEVAPRTDEVRTQFADDGLRVVQEGFVVANGDDADLVGREPEREIAGVMLDEETDEPLCVPSGAR